jgi:hypothetical protein
LINCLLDRAHIICSAEESLKNEIKKLKQILSKNEYPPKILANTIRKLMELKNSARDNRGLLLKDMLHIHKIKPELNIQRSTNLFSFLIGNRDVT